MAPPDLILASHSVRRRNLLEHWGFQFRQANPPFQDPPEPRGRDPRRLAATLAEQKAKSLFQKSHLRPKIQGLVLGADTIVVDSSGHLLGQPQTREEAGAMLAAIADAGHEVVTAICLIDGGTAKTTTFTETARVRVGEIPGPVRETYLESEAWRGKAGGYDLWEVAGHWPVEVDGDPTTVVGLPMRRLTTALHHWAIKPKHPDPPLPWHQGSNRTEHSI